jgi:hypothetical protein
MLLLHGGSPPSTKKIAARWADTRKVQQVLSGPTARGTTTPRHSSATIKYWT